MASAKFKYKRRREMEIFLPSTKKRTNDIQKAMQSAERTFKPTRLIWSEWEQYLDNESILINNNKFKYYGT